MVRGVELGQFFILDVYDALVAGAGAFFVRYVAGDHGWPGIACIRHFTLDLSLKDKWGYTDSGVTLSRSCTLEGLCQTNEKSTSLQFLNPGEILQLVPVEPGKWVPAEVVYGTNYQFDWSQVNGSS